MKARPRAHSIGRMYLAGSWEGRQEIRTHPERMRRFSLSATRAGLALCSSGDGAEPGGGASPGGRGLSWRAGPGRPGGGDLTFPPGLGGVGLRSLAPRNAPWGFWRMHLPRSPPWIIAGKPMIRGKTIGC